MVRRIHLVVLASVTALIGFATLPATAQSGRTFYIDYASGSNSNSGTSEGSPWKTHPYMGHGASCDSGGPSYSHATGDRFIFKGGVTWPNACFTMILGAGGTSSVNDYYGVDKTWFTGGSWTRPIFDAQGAAMSRYTNNFIFSTVSYFTVDNIEMKNQIGVDESTGDPCMNASVDVYNPTGGTAIWENLYLHAFTWTQSVLMGTPAFSGGEGGLCAGGTAVTAQYNTITNVDGGIVGQPSGQTPGIGCFRGIWIVGPGNTCSYYATGVNGAFSVHDNEFGHGSEAVATYNGLYHSNDMQDAMQLGMLVYNNLLHDSTVAQHVNVAPGGAVFNNVTYNIGGQNSALMMDNGIASLNAYPSAVTYFFNNTEDCSSLPCIIIKQRGGLSLGTIYIRNNIFINIAGNGGTSISNPQGYSYTESNDHSMLSGEASLYGFTPANEYNPSSPDPNVSTQGTNLTSLCSGSQTALCQDAQGAPWFGGAPQNRPTGGNWDLGAMQFGATSLSRPAAPTALVATVQ